MSEEKVNQASQPPTKKHWPIVVSVLAVLVIAGFTAFLHWHESPTFCNVVCHQPMDRYVNGYYSEDDSLLVVKHKQAEVTCLGCHWTQAKMLDLVHEVVMWTTDSFTDPLTDEVGIASDEFCGACHDGVTAMTKEEATKDYARDPHNFPAIDMHEGIQCSSCHKVHKQSIMACAECHTDMEVPDGWAKPAPADGLTYTAETYGLYDPHQLVGTEMFESLSDFHKTAGANGAIACSDCHSANVADGATSTTPNTLMCARCHADVFTAETLPAGWDAPEDAKAATAAMGIYDPHQLVGTEMFESLTPFHTTAGANGAIACADCHDSQTFVCARCHSDSYEGMVPDGWTVPDDARAALAENYGMIDPHMLITLDPYKEAAFHQSGVEGGAYSCLDCHTASGENVFVCAQCHATDFADLTAQLADKGWTIPEGADIPMMGSAA